MHGVPLGDTFAPMWHVPQCSGGDVGVTCLSRAVLALWLMLAAPGSLGDLALFLPRLLCDTHGVECHQRWPMPAVRDMAVPAWRALLHWAGGNGLPGLGSPFPTASTSLPPLLPAGAGASGGSPRPLPPCVAARGPVPSWSRC